MTDWSDFIKCTRGLLIAPAGHGKTTAIADCLLQCPIDSCQLVLTHTHAGIASLRNKFKQKNVPSSRYQIETITGFAQRYVLSFIGSSALPEEEDKSYFNVAIEKCCSLIQTSVVQNVIKASFSGIFVDEYQDCTIDQHNMIMGLAKNLPLHLLGDPLQGIFSFEDKPLVDFEKDFCLFTRFELLDYPWRWKKSNPALGQFIFRIRKELEVNHKIEIASSPKDNIFVITCLPSDKYSCLGRLIQQQKSNNILIICPSYKEYDNNGKLILRGGLNERIVIKQRTDYANKFSVLDAIDSSEYYKCAKMIDSFIEKCLRGNRIKKVARLHDILKSLHLNITEVNKWIDKSKNTLKQRTKENASFSKKLKESFSHFEADVNLSNLRTVLTQIVQLPQIKSYHKIFYYTIDKCFNIAQINNISMFEAMKLQKTRLRHQGRSVDGLCFGTTLLTKGLEFETVIIWDAHKFDDVKNFYVAISRACKRLIIMTETKSLTFDK